MLELDDLRAITENFNDDIEILIGTSNATIPISNIEIRLTDKQSKKVPCIVLKCDVDDFIDLAELLKRIIIIYKFLLTYNVMYDIINYKLKEVVHEAI